MTPTVLEFNTLASRFVGSPGTRKNKNQISKHIEFIKNQGKEDIINITKNKLNFQSCNYNKWC